MSIPMTLSCLSFLGNVFKHTFYLTSENTCKHFHCKVNSRRFPLVTGRHIGGPHRVSTQNNVSHRPENWKGGWKICFLQPSEFLAFSIKQFWTYFSWLQDNETIYSLRKQGRKWKTEQALMIIPRISIPPFVHSHNSLRLAPQSLAFWREMFSSLN